MDKAEIIRLRQQIVAADESLFDLLNERMNLSKQMAAAKGESPVYDPAREEALVKMMTDYAKTLPNISEEMVQGIYPYIFKQSRDLQHQEKTKENKVTNEVDKHTPGDKWEFDASVAKCFDNMLARSIPSYETMRALTYQIGMDVLSRFTPGLYPGMQHSMKSVLDLGASRGEALAPFAEDRDIQCWAIEISDPMLDELNSRFMDYPNVEIYQDDLRNPHVFQCPDTIGFPDKFGLILSILTIQFTPIEYRLEIIQQIYDALPEGGAFIFVEKILGSGSRLNKLFVDKYYEYKHANGYSYEDIDRKKASLEGVLVPQTASANEEMLRLAGFRQIDCFYRHLNFAGWVCIK